MKRTLKIIIITTLLAITACSPKPYATTNKAYKQQVKQYAKLLQQYPLQDSVGNAPYFVGTTNFNMRKPNFVIIHHTAQNSCEQTLKTFTLPRTQVSAHYIICKDGTVHHMLNDYLRAWHAGNSYWSGVTDVNSASIGIELDNNGAEIFDDRQLASLLQLLARLKASFNIPTTNFIGHADIAPTRKNNPNKFFPWYTLAANGYGNWYADTTAIQVPTNFSAVTAFRIIGYNTKDTMAVIQTFKRKYNPTDSLPYLTEADKKILYRLTQ